MEAIGFSGGIWVGWKDMIQVEIMSNHPQFILLWVLEGINSQLILIAFVYRSSNTRKSLLEDLKLVIPDSSIPRFAIDDFNVIMSPN